MEKEVKTGRKAYPFVYGLRNPNMGEEPDHTTTRKPGPL
jgi:hypothetical protein